MVYQESVKAALDSLINKSRVHLYKPIQIAEILFHDRVIEKIDFLNLESYRSKSKKWRDDVCIDLLGRKCTSSARFQDDLFNENAIPPRTLQILGAENRWTNGAVEAYIYGKFISKYAQLSEALEYCVNSTKDSFYVKHFIDSFWNEPGLKRSIDKIYEIVVFSLFSTLVHALDFKIEVSVDEEKKDLLKEFEDFSRLVMCIDYANLKYSQDARVYRVGVTNAADRGLDMYSNWGPAIQIKHLSLDEELAENIVESISSDRIVIVCKNVEKKVIVSLLNQIGWKSKIQSIITEDNLIEWYEKALRGKYCDILGSKLLKTLSDEISQEFPATESIPDILKERHYEKISNDYWKNE